MNKNIYVCKDTIFFNIKCKNVIFFENIFFCRELKFVNTKMSPLRKVFFTAKAQRNRKVRKCKLVKINSLRTLRKPFANLAVKILTFRSGLKNKTFFGIFLSEPEFQRLLHNSSTQNSKRNLARMG